MTDSQVFFATNRNLLCDENGQIEDSLISPVGPRFGIHPSDFRVGIAKVTITESKGKSIRSRANADVRYQSASLAPEKRDETGEYVERGSDDVYPLLIKALRRYSNAGKGETPPKRWSALVFVPGFNYSFQDSIERGALLAHIYATENHRLVPFVFSWPSDGELLFAYTDDREDAEYSGAAAARAFRVFIKHLAGTKRGERCLSSAFLVAHSMGAYALRYAVQHLERRGDKSVSLFDAAILPAADEDADSLESKEKLLPLSKLAGQIVVYVNRNDAALKFATDSPRLGQQGPRTRGIDTIPVPVTTIHCEENFHHKSDITEHQYYRLSPYVIRDIRAVLDGQEASRISYREELKSGNYRLSIRRTRAAVRLSRR